MKDILKKQKKNNVKKLKTKKLTQDKTMLSNAINALED